MACPQCEWEIFQSGKYEPILHGRRRKSTPSSVPPITFTTTTTSLKEEIELKKDVRSLDITTRISNRRKSLPSLSSSVLPQPPQPLPATTTTTSSGIKARRSYHHNLEILSGELINQQIITNKYEIRKTRQSLCQICSLDLR